jgi:hypothetical protein
MVVGGGTYAGAGSVAGIGGGSELAAGAGSVASTRLVVWSSVMSPSSSPDRHAAEEAATAAASGELLHQALHLRELLDQPIDLGQRGPGSGRDPPAA